MKGGGPPAGGSVPARLPRRNFLCGRSLYRLVPFLWSACSLYGRKQLSAFTESHHHAFMVGISCKLSVRHSRSASRSLLDLLASLARLFAYSSTGRAQTLAPSNLTITTAKKQPPEWVVAFLAEQVRFELTDGFRPSHDFQSCPL